MWLQHCIQTQTGSPSVPHGACSNPTAEARSSASAVSMAACANHHHLWRILSSLVPRLSDPQVSYYHLMVWYSIYFNMIPVVSRYPHCFTCVLMSHHVGLPFTIFYPLHPNKIRWLWTAQSHAIKCLIWYPSHFFHVTPSNPMLKF
jgi:hypothetical protein